MSREKTIHDIVFAAFFYAFAINWLIGLQFFYDLILYLNLTKVEFMYNLFFSSVIMVMVVMFRPRKPYETDGGR